MFKKISNIIKSKLSFSFIDDFFKERLVEGSVFFVLGFVISLFSIFVIWLGHRI